MVVPTSSTSGARPRRVAIYACSSRGGERATLDLDRQEADCRERLAQHPTWVIDGVFRDVRHSGKPRPAFDRMAAAIKAGEVDTVIAYSADRLSRRLEDSSQASDGADRSAVWSFVVGRRTR